MIRRCSHANCYVHDGEACADGTVDFVQCSYWSAGASQVEAAGPVLPSSATARVPWSGSTLGLADLANLVPRGRPILVGVMGAHDSGKSTLLTGSYLQLLRGQTLADARFAGSRTLGAWESLAAWARFEDAARPPSFPPHTPRGTSRVPGMLHLAIRGPADELRDILLTDAPGEWFTRWSVKEDAPEAEGARWVVRHAHSFLVLADCERLCGPERGSTRSDTRKLLERLGNHVGERPTVLVWAKADNQPNHGIREAIRKTLKEQVPHATEVEATTERPGSLSEALEAVLRPAWSRLPARVIVEPILQHQSFAAFRGTTHARS